MENYTPTYIPTGEEIAVFKTVKGTVTVLLRGADTPINAGCFIELAHDGFYDQLKVFKRQEGEFVKAGCPTTRYLPPASVRFLAPRSTAAIGMGHTGYAIADETDAPGGNLHDRGALVMAHGTKMSFASCQFYFCLGPMHHLDRTDTVIGEVVEGMDVVDALDVGDEILGIEVTNLDETQTIKAVFK